MKQSSKTGRYAHGKQYVPRSATYKAGSTPVGQHHTYSKKSKARKGG